MHVRVGPDVWAIDYDDDGKHRDEPENFCFYPRGCLTHADLSTRFSIFVNQSRLEHD